MTYLIRGYQWVISPLLPRACRFYPSCSNYALQAFQTNHFWKALGMSVLRLCKCHPFHPGGYDPVPTGECKKHVQ
ncbi:MAG: membrane protein insertion efficiency factor YidD [Bdellovibrionota bacterium]